MDIFEKLEKHRSPKWDIIVLIVIVGFCINAACT